jgi:hypothetical protein
MPRVTKQQIIDQQRADLCKLNAILANTREAAMVARAELKGHTNAGSIDDLLGACAQIVTSCARMISDVTQGGKQ